MTPDFAQPIIDARAAGKRPADLVVVQDGDLGLNRYLPNPVVRIQPSRRASAYDFRFLADLDVEIATNGTSDRAINICRAVLKARPRYLRLWHPEAGTATRIWWNGMYQCQPESLAVCGMKSWN